MNTMNEESQSDDKNICQFCNKIFSTRGSLLIHQRKTKKCLLLQGKSDNKKVEEDVDKDESDVEKDDVDKDDKDKKHRAEIEKLMSKLEDREDYIERLCGKLNRYELTIIKLYAHLCGSYENYTHSDYERYGDDIARLTQNYLRYINEHPELTKNDTNDKNKSDDTKEKIDDTNENE